MQELAAVSPSSRPGGGWFRQRLLEQAMCQLFENLGRDRHATRKSARQITGRPTGIEAEHFRGKDQSLIFGHAETRRFRREVTMRGTSSDALRHPITA